MNIEVASLLISIVLAVTDAYRETVAVFDEWKDHAERTIIWLSSQIETCKLHRKNVNISNLVGSSMGIFGGSLAIVGTVLIPFSFGASTPLIFAGMGIAIPGATVTVGSSITEAVLTKVLIFVTRCFKYNFPIVAIVLGYNRR